MFFKDREKKEKQQIVYSSYAIYFFQHSKLSILFSKIQLTILISPDNKCDCKWRPEEHPCFILQFHVFKRHFNKFSDIFIYFFPNILP